MTGDADRQPVEGADTLSDLAAAMDDTGAEAGDEGSEQVGDEGEDEAPDDVEESEDSDEAEDGDDESPAAKKKFTIKHDGKEVDLELTPDEEVAMLQQSFDYSKKTMAVAEDRKAVEAEKTLAVELRKKVEQEAAETVDRLTAYTQFIEAQAGQPPPISLASQDAASYLAQKELHESRKGQLQQAYSEIKRIQDEQARQRQAWIAEKAESTEKALRDTLKGWNDKTLDELAEYAGKSGLTPQTADLAMLNPGFWEVVNKAKAYDALQAEKAKLKPKSELPRVQRPSGANHPNRGQVKREDAEKAYRQNPSLRTLSALIE